MLQTRIVEAFPDATILVDNYKIRIPRLDTTIWRIEDYIYLMDHIDFQDVPARLNVAMCTDTEQVLTKRYYNAKWKLPGYEYTGYEDIEYKYFEYKGLRFVEDDVGDQYVMLM